MRTPLALLALLLLALPARAQHISGNTVGGIEYPDFAGACSPSCVGARVTFTIPALLGCDKGHVSSALGTAQGIFVWVGIGGPAASLAQVGLYAILATSNCTTTQYLPFYEVAPDFNPTQLGSFTVSPGDNVTATVMCASNCTRVATKQSWTFSMTNNTTGGSGSVTTSAAYHTDLNAPRAGVEFLATTSVNYGSVRFQDFQVNKGSGWISVPVSTNPADQMIYQNLPGSTRWNSPSRMDPSGAFTVCFNNSQTNGTTPPPFCPLGPYSGTAGVVGHSRPARSQPQTGARLRR